MTIENDNPNNLYFRGLGVALVTPFSEDLSIDIQSFRKHIEFQIENGVKLLIPAGTTGESVTMSVEEQLLVIQETVKAAKDRAKILAGVGGNNTAEVVIRAHAVLELGIDGILSSSPAYNKPTQQGLVEHYRTLAGQVDCPIVIYNVPGRTSSNVLPETVLKLAEIENIVGIKESSADFDQVMSLLKDRPRGFSILSGEDNLTFPLIAAGADGVISVVANQAPRLMSEMVEASLAGEYDKARDLHYHLLPLMRANFLETNPIPVKAALEMMGRMKARYRLPLVPLSPEVAPKLQEALHQAGLI
jgi:4-hydroxy-tetrahydrodipicolinate synthase|tara:strand:- start:2931 stop:3839 length:909 start_codon:yes stop_codon:yes gene_type:complete